MRILCLDIGHKRIGIAVCDETETLARSVAVIERNGGEIQKIRALAVEFAAIRILFGIPFRHDGSMGPAAEKILSYVETLKKEIAVAFEPWDERFTTKEAENILLTADLGRSKRKKVIDRLAAQIILQDYLDSRKPPPEPGEFPSEFPSDPF